MTSQCNNISNQLRISAQAIVKQLKAQSGNADGSINASVWNEFVKDKGHTIKNYISEDNAVKSITKYLFDQAQDTTAIQNKADEWSESISNAEKNKKVKESAKFELKLEDVIKEDDDFYADSQKVKEITSKKVEPEEDKDAGDEQTLQSSDSEGVTAKKMLTREVNGEKKTIVLGKDKDGNKVHYLYDGNAEGGIGEELVTIAAAGKNKYITKSKMEENIKTVFPNGLPEGVEACYVSIGGTPTLVFKKDGKTLDQSELRKMANDNILRLDKMGKIQPAEI